jgi:hypothetical protein
MCVDCEMLIAQEAEMRDLIDSLRSHRVGSAEDVVLGTLDTTTWRRGLSGSVTIDEGANTMADFKAYRRVDITPPQLVSKERRHVTGHLAQKMPILMGVFRNWRKESMPPGGSHRDLGSNPRAWRQSCHSYHVEVLTFISLHTLVGSTLAAKDDGLAAE